MSSRCQGMRCWKNVLILCQDNFISRHMSQLSVSCIRPRGWCSGFEYSCCQALTWRIHRIILLHFVTFFLSKHLDPWKKSNLLILRENCFISVLIDHFLLILTVIRKGNWHEWKKIHFVSIFFDLRRSLLYLKLGF